MITNPRLLSSWFIFLYEGNYIDNRVLNTAKAVDSDREAPFNHPAHAEALLTNTKIYVIEEKYDVPD